MTAVTQRITVPPDRRIRLDFKLPEEVPPGEAEVRVEILASDASRRRRGDISRWFGVLAHSPAFNGDPVIIQREMRDEWPD